MHRLREELSRIRLVLVNEDRAEFVPDYSFGEKVERAFPSSIRDVADAGGCLAVDLNTAAVFHLMRVAEHGLRAIAHDRRIKIPKKRPVELATWDDIIKGLEKAEDDIIGYPQTLAREAQLAFYHGAMMQLKRFKNVFRNRVSHTREDFGRTQALGVLENVREFMGTLATRISEKTRTPVVWKGKKWES
jgi:hypothetical protein